MKDSKRTCLGANLRPRLGTGRLAHAPVGTFSGWGNISGKVFASHLPARRRGGNLLCSGPPPPPYALAKPQTTERKQPMIKHYFTRIMKSAIRAESNIQARVCVLEQQIQKLEKTRARQIPKPQKGNNTRLVRGSYACRPVQVGLKETCFTFANVLIKGKIYSVNLQWNTGRKEALIATGSVAKRKAEYPIENNYQPSKWLTVAHYKEHSYAHIKNNFKKAKSSQILKAGTPEILATNLAKLGFSDEAIDIAVWRAFAKVGYCDED